MSTSRNNKRKAARASRTEYQVSIDRQIRQGEIPAYFMVKQVEGGSALQREHKSALRKPYKLGMTKYTWRQKSTRAHLGKGE